MKSKEKIALTFLALVIIVPGILCVFSGIKQLIINSYDNIFYIILLIIGMFLLVITAAIFNLLLKGFENDTEEMQKNMTLYIMI